MTDDQREVLELRVHGVNNTPPAAMLDLPPEDVEEVLGDPLAGFWRPKTAQGAPGTGDPDDATRGHVPDGITREAYSWGGLARRSPGGGISAGSRLIAGLITVGWTLLLPFGLANVAYWTRRLDESPGRTPGSGPGAGLIRIFGLCLTSFLVVTLCEVSMDLVAAQCYRSPGKGEDVALVCSRLPGFLGGIAGIDLSVRLVLFSAVPLIVLVGLWALSSLSRSRYERAYGSSPPPTTTKSKGLPEGAVRRPLLTDARMWSRDDLVGRFAHLHLAAGLAMVAICLTWPATFRTRSRCASRLVLPGPDCVYQNQVDAHVKVLTQSAVIAAIAVVVLTAVLAVPRPRRRRHVEVQTPVPRSRIRWPLWLLVLSIGVLGYSMGILLSVRPAISAEPALPGVNGLPTVLLLVMLALAVGAFFLRTAPLLAWPAALVVAGSLFLLTRTSGAAQWAGLALILLIAGTLVWLLWPSGARRFQAWAGTGPGIFLGAALLAQGVISAAVVLGVGDWLNGSNGAGKLLPGPTPSPGKVMRDDCGNLCPIPDPSLTAPLADLLLGAVGVASIGLVLLAAGTSLVISSASGRKVPAGIQQAVRRARLVARVAHRAEKLVGLLAVTSLLMILAVTVSLAAGWLPDRPNWLRALDVTTPAVTLTSAAILGALVKGSGGGGRRPLGLVWDLVSFLPRAAHPFAPPCYAERAVPELAERVAWWLKQENVKPGAQRRGGERVVISAHSLGGVLTVAALMRGSLETYERAGRIRLLTYGSQLRAYFSRIFPELLGPHVLGIPPSLAGAYRSADPWATEKESRPPAERPEPSSVLARLSPIGVVGWRSLWRPTDYLGFPVWSFSANSIDRRAGEVDRSGYLLEVVTHSNYPRSPQYRSALRELAGLRESSGRPEEPTPPIRPRTPLRALIDLIGRWLRRNPPRTP